jgi:hypothetical protein
MDLQFWKSTRIFPEDIHNVLNCHNVARYCKFDARGTVVPNTTTTTLLQLKLRWLISQVQSVLVVCFDGMKRSMLHKFKQNVGLSIAWNLPVGLQFTRCTRILLRPDVLWGMPNHPIAHVFLTLQWNCCLGRASFEVREGQRDVRLGKQVFQILQSRECYENVYT